MAKSNPAYIHFRKMIYNSVVDMKSNMIMLRKSSMLKKNEKEKVADVLIALEALRQELALVKQPKKDNENNS